ncbi:hypothetical protein BV510_01875, partial [Mycolicibacterium diernhoferi]
VDIDLVESLGADKYLHFRTEGSGAKAAQLAELAAESGAGELLRGDDIHDDAALEHFGHTALHPRRTGLTTVLRCGIHNYLLRSTTDPV